MLLQFTPAGRCLAFCLGIMVVSVAGCLPMKQARVGAVALTVQDVGRAAARQTSPTIVGQGMPAYLMLLVYSLLHRNKISCGFAFSEARLKQLGAGKKK